MATKEKKPAKVPKIPATPGAAIDLLSKTRDERKAVEAKVAALKADEEAIEVAIFDKFKKADLEGARGKKAQASISRSEVPTIEDWDKFETHVLKTRSLDLLQRRLGVDAFRERWERNEVIPGTGRFQKVKLHLTKMKAKR